MLKLYINTIPYICTVLQRTQFHFSATIQLGHVKLGERGIGGWGGVGGTPPSLYIMCRVHTFPKWPQN